MNFTITFNALTGDYEAEVNGNTRRFKLFRIAQDGSALWVRFKNGNERSVATSTITNFEGLNTARQMRIALDSLAKTDALAIPTMRVLAQLYKELSPGTPDATIAANLRSWWQSEN